MKMAAGAEGRANMVFTEVTIGPLGAGFGLRDVVPCAPRPGTSVRACRTIAGGSGRRLGRSSGPTA